jgi:hypothetical protein
MILGRFCPKHSTISNPRLKIHEKLVISILTPFLLLVACGPEGPTRSLLPGREAHNLLYLHHRGN